MATPERLDTASSTLSTSDPSSTSTVSTDDTGAPDPYSDAATKQILYDAVMATNAISLAACIFTVLTYIFLRRKYPRLMSRTSLRLSIAMACSDAILHVKLTSLKWSSRLGADKCSPPPGLLVCGPHRLFQRWRWFRLWICRRVDVHNPKLSVHVLCLRYCIKHPTRLCTRIRPKGQQANLLLHRTSNPLTPYQYASRYPFLFFFLARLILVYVPQPFLLWPQGYMASTRLTTIAGTPPMASLQRQSSTVSSSHGASGYSSPPSISSSRSR